jgi:glycosyltransferase involved in cell wall biosynthesis
MFSIIIPCHNDTDLLRLCLAGFASQDCDLSFEVILVDNNSFRQDINAAYEDYVPRLSLFLIRQPLLEHPMAMCQARNIGLAIARFPWIINIDADCVPPPCYLENIAEGIEAAGLENPIFTGLRRFVKPALLTEAMVLERRVDFDGLEQVRSPSNYYQLEDRRLPQIRDLAHCDHPWAMVHSCNMVYRCEVARSVGGYDEAFDGCWGYEDTDFAHRMITQVEAKPAFLESAEVFHLDSPWAAHRDRFNKRQNRNWHMITRRIPGLKDFKSQKYRTMSEDIIV